MGQGEVVGVGAPEPGLRRSVVGGPAGLPSSRAFPSLSLPSPKMELVPLTREAVTFPWGPSPLPSPLQIKQLTNY